MVLQIRTPPSLLKMEKCGEGVNNHSTYRRLWDPSASSRGQLFSFWRVEGDSGPLWINFRSVLTVMEWKILSFFPFMMVMVSYRERLGQCREAAGREAHCAQRVR